MIDQFNKEVVALKHESLAVEKLYMLKDCNVRRRAEIVKLRTRLENLRSDVQIHAMSHKLKLQELAAKMSEPSAEQKLDETSDVSKSGEKSIDSE